MLVPISVKVPLVRNIIDLPEAVRKTHIWNIVFYIFWKPVDTLYLTRKENNFKVFSISSLEKEDNCSSIWIGMHVCIYINITAYTVPPDVHRLATISVCHGSTILMKCFRVLIEVSHVVTIWLSSQSWSNWFLW